MPPRMKDRAQIARPPRALVNIYGPDGTLCSAGEVLPPDWPTEFVEELLSTGGATSNDTTQE